MRVNQDPIFSRLAASYLFHCILRVDVEGRQRVSLAEVR